MCIGCPHWAPKQSQRLNIFRQRSSFGQATTESEFDQQQKNPESPTEPSLTRFWQRKSRTQLTSFTFVTRKTIFGRCECLFPQKWLEVRRQPSSPGLHRKQRLLRPVSKRCVCKTDRRSQHGIQPIGVIRMCTYYIVDCANKIAGQCFVIPTIVRIWHIDRAVEVADLNSEMIERLARCLPAYKFVPAHNQMGTMVPTFSGQRSGLEPCDDGTMVFV
jgi:hypothetical protein